MGRDRWLPTSAVTPRIAGPLIANEEGVYARSGSFDREKKGVRVDQSIRRTPNKIAMQRGKPINQKK